MNIKIDHNLFVTVDELAASTQETVTEVPTHRILIYDRSGSMYSILGQVAEDMCALVDAFSKKDVLSIGWFSGEGQFRFMCKGMSCERKADIKRVIRENASTVGLTCFSEISADAVTVAEEMRAFMPMPTALTFLTDGNPVVSNYQKEMANLKAALNRLGTVVETAVFVGYGSWYNRETLSSMAWWTGGTFVHAASIGDVRKIYSKYHVDTQVEKRFPYRIPKCKNIIAIYALHRGSVSLFDPSDTQILVPEGAVVGVIHEFDDVPVMRHVLSKETIENAMYAGALAASQNARADVAMAILGTLGDVGLAQLVSNCITQDEVGHAEKWLITAVEGKERYAQGKKVGCVPTENATSVFDILEVLVNGDAKFYPYHEEFEYKRTGVKTTVAEGYSKFTADKEVACPISALVFHSKRLNASLQVTIPGTIELGKEAKKVGLPETYPTKQIRTYTIIKDGRLNVTRIPVTLNKDTWNKLYKLGVFDRAWTRMDENTIVTIPLLNYPVMNRAMGKKYLSTKVLGDLTLSELGLEAELKAIKARIAEYDTTPEPTPFQTKEQIQFLLEAGISEKGIYSPPSDAGESTDVYEARGVEVVIKGLSSLPSVNDVKKKISSGKPFTRGEQIVKDAMDQIDSAIKGEPDKLARLQELEKDVKNELRQVRYEMAKTRASVILGGRWFTELGSRNNTVFKHRDYEIELKDRLERVAY